MNGCLIIHGLTGTPATVSSMKEHLMSCGFKVAVPCLAGHGGFIEQLARSKWQDWYETVRIAYRELQKSAEKIYYVGLSLGALLGLKLAADEGWGIRALALLSTPLILTRTSSLTEKVVRRSPLRFVVGSIAKDFERSVLDPEGREAYASGSLHRIPVESVYQIVDLQKTLLKDIKRVVSPLLLVHSVKDHVAPMKNLALVEKSVGSEIVERLILKESGHVLTMDKERMLVAKHVVDFFKKF